MLSGFIFKELLRPVCSFADTPPVQSKNFKIQTPPVVGWLQVLRITPSPPQSPKENKFKLRLKIYVLPCTLYACMMYIMIEKNLSQMFQNYSELYLAVPSPTLQAAHREGWPGDSDHYLCHLPEDLRS
jgi:hypothetical protein